MAVPVTNQDNRANGHRLESLPYPVYFVRPYCERWADTFEATEPQSPTSSTGGSLIPTTSAWWEPTCGSGTTGSRSDSCRNWSLVRSTSS